MLTRATTGVVTFDFNSLADGLTSDKQCGDCIPTENIKSGMLVANVSNMNSSGGGNGIKVRVCAAFRLATGDWVIDSVVGRELAVLTLGNGDNGLFRVAFSSSILPGPAVAILVTGTMGTRSSPSLRVGLELALELLNT